MNKATIFIMLYIMLASINTLAQTGIYVTLQDYKNNKLSYESDCSKGKQIHTNSFFVDGASITAKKNNKKYKLKKASIFGYKDCNNHVYRFYKNTEYNILETSNIYIYSRQKNIAQHKGFQVVNDYFFSVSGESEILKLTLGNIRYAYQNNEKFQVLLNQFFTGDNITAYDNQHKTFKINYVYSKTINDNK